LESKVAARLDESASYGIFLFNRTRTTRKRLSEAGPDGREYRWERKVHRNPRAQWIAIPVPDAGLLPETVEAARGMVRYNERAARTSRRFWEIPGGAVRCGDCGMRMLKYAGMAGGKVYAYYKCSRLIRNGKDACSPDRRRTNHRAEGVEQRVWGLVSGLLKDPEQLRADLERMIELEQRETRGDPEQHEKAWIDRLSEIGRMRRGYQEQAAKGLMNLDELGEALRGLEEDRKAAEKGLEAVKRRQERIEQLERDKDTLLRQYAAVAPEALDSLTPTERCHVYKMLRLDVLVHPDEHLEVSGAFGAKPLFSNQETVSR
jgi:hypothetical protein